MNLPNFITLIRLALTPVVAYTIVIGWSINSALLFGFAAATDWIDGLAARKFDSHTDFGKIFDPLVDRIFISGVIIALVLVRQQPPLWMVLAIVLRDVILLGSGQIIYKVKGERIDINFLGKLSTFIIMWSIPFILLGWQVAINALLMGIIISYIAAMQYIGKGYKVLTGRM